MGEVSESQILDSQKNALKKSLDRADIVGIDKTKLVETLSGTLEEIRAKIGADLKKAFEALNGKSTGLTDKEKAIMEAYALLEPEQAFKGRLESTNAPSSKISLLIVKGGDALKMEELKKLPPEKLAELFQSLNKGDLKAIAKSIPDAKPEGMSEASFLALKTLTASTIATMIESGMSIENSDDIAFLEKNGGPNIQKVIQESKSKGILKEYKEGAKYIIKKEGNDLKITQINAVKPTLPEGMDISKINTVDMKKGAPQLLKELPPSFDKSKIEGMVRDLLNSSNTALRGLGELFKILGPFLGLNFDKKADGVAESLDKKGRYNLLKNMVSGKNGYTLGEIYGEKGTLKIEATDPKYQLYLGDIAQLRIAANIPNKGPDGKYQNNDALTSAIKTYQKSLGIPETGYLDAAGMNAVIARYDVNGDIIAPPAQAEAPPIEQLHPQAGLIQTLRGGSFNTIRSNATQRKAIQDAFGVTEAYYGPKTIAAVKKFQQEELKMPIGNGPNDADGKFGKNTIDAFDKKFPNGKIEAPPPAPKR